MNQYHQALVVCSDCCPAESVQCRVNSRKACHGHPTNGEDESTLQDRENIVWKWEKLPKLALVLSGQLCPKSHPVPCANGAFCTSMMRSSNNDYCSADDVNEGLCCPERSVACRPNKSGYKCQAHPNYGRAQLMPIEVVVCFQSFVLQESPVPPLTPFLVWADHTAQIFSRLSKITAPRVT